jgi:hypothetical protein
MVELQVGGRDGPGHPGKHVLGALDGLPVIPLAQVPTCEHAEGVFGDLQLLFEAVLGELLIEHGDDGPGCNLGKLLLLQLRSRFLADASGGIRFDGALPDQRLLDPAGVPCRRLVYVNILEQQER